MAQKSSQKYQKNRNNTLDGINEEGSYTNSGNFSQTNRSFEIDETYNNTQASISYNNSSIGYNNSSIGYNNTQPSLGDFNENEQVENGRDGQSTSYLSHN